MLTLTAYDARDHPLSYEAANHFEVLIQDQAVSRPTLGLTRHPHQCLSRSSWSDVGGLAIAAVATTSVRVGNRYRDTLTVQVANTTGAVATAWLTLRFHSGAPGEEGYRQFPAGTSTLAYSYFLSLPHEPSQVSLVP